MRNTAAHPDSTTDSAAMLYSQSQRVHPDFDAETFIDLPLGNEESEAEPNTKRPRLLFEQAQNSATKDPGNDLKSRRCRNKNDKTRYFK